jgi:hypothetical protein
MPPFLLALLTLFVTLAGLVAQASGDTKAAELLAMARAAIGGDTQVAGVQGLSCTGTVSRAIGDHQIAGELVLDLQLPDKMLRTETISPAGDSAFIVTAQGINGDALLRTTKTVNAPPGMVIRTPPPPPPGSDAEMQALRNSRAELLRLAVAMLLSPPAAASIDFTYAGEAEAPEGKADVLDLKSGGGFAGKLFLDKSTHRPLMLAYRGVAPRMVVQTRHQPPDAARRDPPAPPAPEVVDIAMFFDDYQAVNGLLLPHHITRSVDGRTTEEWTFKTIRINPAFKADAFAAK